MKGTNQGFFRAAMAFAGRMKKSLGQVLADKSNAPLIGAEQRRIEDDNYVRRNRARTAIGALHVVHDAATAGPSRKIRRALVRSGDLNTHSRVKLPTGGGMQVDEIVYHADKQGTTARCERNNSKLRFFYGEAPEVLTAMPGVTT